MAKGCSQCLRIFVIIINSLFLLIGLAILGLALFLYFDANARSIKESSMMKMSVDIALFVAMAIGGLTVMVSAFGCCGAYHESACLLSTFFVLVILICGVEIGGGILVYVRRTDTDIKASVIDSIRGSIRNANETTLPQYIKDMQQYLQCCGVNGTKDYDEKTAEAVCSSAKDGKIFTEGCASRLLRFIEENSLWVLIVILGIAALELLSLILAISLCCVVKREGDGYMGVSTD